MLSIRNPYSAFEHQGTANLLDELLRVTEDDRQTLIEKIAAFGQYVRHDVLRVTDYVRSKFRTEQGIRSLLQTLPRELIRPGSGVLAAAALAYKDRVRLTLADIPVVLQDAKGPRVVQLRQQHGLWTSRELPSAASLEAVSQEVLAARMAPERPLARLVWTPELSREDWTRIVDHLRRADPPSRELVHRALERLGFAPTVSLSGNPGPASVERQPGGHQLTELAHATIRALYTLEEATPQRTAELIYAAYISEDLDGLALLRDASILQRLTKNKADPGRRGGVVDKTTLALVAPCLDLVRFIPTMHACRADTRGFLLASRLALIALTRHVATKVQYCGELTLRLDEGPVLQGLDKLLSSQWNRSKDWLFTVVVEDREAKFVRYRMCAFLAQRVGDKLLVFDPCQDRRVLAAVRSACRQFQKLRSRRVRSVLLTDAYQDIAGCTSPTALRSCINLIHAFVLCPDPLHHFRRYPKRMIAFGRKVNARLYAVVERALYKYAAVMRIQRQRAEPVATDDPVAQLKDAGLWDTLSARTLAPKNDNAADRQVSKLMQASLSVAGRLGEEDQTRLMRQFFARSVVLWNRPDSRLKGDARLQLLLRLAEGHTDYDEEAWTELMELRLDRGTELAEAVERYAKVYGTEMPEWKTLDEVRDAPQMERYYLDAELYPRPKGDVVAAMKSLGLSLFPRNKAQWQWVGSRLNRAPLPPELTRQHLKHALVGWARGWQGDEGLLPIADASDEMWESIRNSPEREVNKALLKYRQRFNGLSKPRKEWLSGGLEVNDMEEDELDEISESELAQYILPQSEWLSSSSDAPSAASAGQYALDGQRLRSAIPNASLALLPALYKRLGGESAEIHLRFSDDWLGRKIAKDQVLRNALLLMEKHSTPIIRAVALDSDPGVKPAELLWHLEGLRVMGGLSGAASWRTVDTNRQREDLKWMDVTAKQVRTWMGTQEDVTEVEEEEGELDSDAEDSAEEMGKAEKKEEDMSEVSDGFVDNMEDSDSYEEEEEEN